MLRLIAVVLVSLVSLVGSTTSFAASGTISGRVTHKDGFGVNALMLIAPASKGRTIDLTEYAPGGAALRTDLVTASQRDGPGLLKADGQGNFSATGLADGDYLVVLADPFVTFADPAPPIPVEFRAQGRATTSHRAYRATISGSNTINVTFVIAEPITAPKTGATTGSLHIEITTFDRTTLRSVPDPILSIAFEPAIPGARLSITGGEALIENIPPGAYVVTVKTASQTHRGDVLIRAGIVGEFNVALRPPRTGDGGIASASWLDAGIGRGLIGLGLILSSVLILRGVIGLWFARVKS